MVQIKIKKKELIKILKPYWKQLEKAQSKYSLELRKIEAIMNLDPALLKSKTPQLEFFYVDEEVVGIGAENYEDRNKFELIHDTELYE